MTYSIVCNTQRILKLIPNITKPIIKADPNTPLKVSLHYHYHLQTNTDESIRSNIFHNMNHTQNHQHLNHNINKSHNQ